VLFTKGKQDWFFEGNENWAKICKYVYIFRFTIFFPGILREILMSRFFLLLLHAIIILTAV